MRYLFTLVGICLFVGQAQAAEITFRMDDARFDHFIKLATEKMGYVGDNTQEDKQKWVADRLFRIATFGWYRDMEQAEITMEVKR